MNVNEIPSFGLLSGVRVVCHGTNLATPFAASMMAEWGADVIWIENPKAPDAARTSFIGQQDRRNVRSLAIDPVANKDAFVKVLTSADIVLESTKGGQYDRWGLTDEFLWTINPKLVITHVSGFGQTGDPEYIKRPAYDPIAQAFSGHMQFNGFPDREPIVAGQFAGDYFPALFALGSSLAALYNAQRTGKGESIDLAMYEALVRTHGRFPGQFLTKGIPVDASVRPGYQHDRFGGMGQYKCADGKQVYISPFGASPFRNCVKFVGLEYGSEDYPEGAVFCITSKKEATAKLIQAISDYCMTKPAAEIEKDFLAAGVPCQMVFTYEDAVKNSQYIARNTFTSWTGNEGETLSGVNVVPKFKNNPTQIWRGMPKLGEDNDDIMKEVGYTDEEIAEMYAEKKLKKGAQKLV